jgi:hypothetical protein
MKIDLLRTKVAEAKEQIIKKKKKQKSRAVRDLACI